MVLDCVLKNGCKYTISARQIFLKNYKYHFFYSVLAFSTDGLLTEPQVRGCYKGTIHRATLLCIYRKKLGFVIFIMLKVELKKRFSYLYGAFICDR